jgi:hypothetical protein
MEFRSSQRFPLRIGSVIIGAITIYSSQTWFFTDEEIVLPQFFGERPLSR